MAEQTPAPGADASLDALAAELHRIRCEHSARAGERPSFAPEPWEDRAGHLKEMDRAMVRAVAAGLAGPAGGSGPEALGRVAYQAFTAWTLEQEQYWCRQSWDGLSGEERELYLRIGSAVAAEALRQYEAERTGASLARLSRSVKLAQIRAYCRRRAGLGDVAEAKVLAHILGIIGGEQSERDQPE